MSICYNERISSDTYVNLFFLSRLTCTYAHRMQTTKGHAPIQDVLKAAGVLAGSTPNRTPSNAEVPRAKPLFPTAPDRATPLTVSSAKERRRRESMHTIRDKESIQSHATTKATRQRRYSIGMMSLEDEERWMAYRHDSIERLRARKDIRRGIARTGSEQSHWSQQNHQLLEFGDIIGDHRRTRSDHASHRI